jgi:hypothetical protein
VGVTGGEGKCRSSGAEVDWRSACHACSCAITDRIDRVLTELAAVVGTPTDDGRVVENRTGVVTSRGDRSGSSSSGKLHRR